MIKFCQSFPVHYIRLLNIWFVGYVPDPEVHVHVGDENNNCEKRKHQKVHVYADY